MSQRSWGRIATWVGLAAWTGPTFVLLSLWVPPFRHLISPQVEGAPILGMVWLYVLIAPIASLFGWILSEPKTLARQCAILQLFAWLVGLGVTLVGTVS